MKLPNITPKEWEWSQGVSIYTESVIIAVTRQTAGHADRPNPPLEEQIANARAIAAVPQLLAALNDCLESMSRMPDTDGAFRVTCIQQARAALIAAGATDTEQALEDFANPSDEQDAEREHVCDYCGFDDRKPAGSHPGCPECQP